MALKKKYDRSTFIITSAYCIALIETNHRRLARGASPSMAFLWVYHSSPSWLWRATPCVFSAELDFCWRLVVISRAALLVKHEYFRRRTMHTVRLTFYALDSSRLGGVEREIIGTWTDDNTNNIGWHKQACCMSDCSPHWTPLQITRDKYAKETRGSIRDVL